MRSIPPVKSVMTPFPHWIDAADPVGRAGAMMSEHGVRHVPVMERGRPVGVLGARDIDERVAGLPCGEVCDRNVYIVDRFEPLDRVLAHMADHRYEAALVVREGKLAGIFTITDACRAFGKLLQTLFPRGDGEDDAA